MPSVETSIVPASALHALGDTRVAAPLASAALPSVLWTLAEQREHVASTARAVERCVGLVAQPAQARQAKMVST